MNASRENPWKRFNGRPLVAPSLLSCDLTCPRRQINEVLAAGSEMLHLDIMDGHFVDNLSFGPSFAKAVSSISDRFLDVHIMVTEPEKWIPPFAEAGADSITFHVEAARDMPTLAEKMRRMDLGVGVSLRPATPVESLRDCVELVDIVLVMTVEPGYGGQEFIENSPERISAIRDMLRDDQRLEVDGGINPQTARLCAEHGADVFVAGNAIFGADDVAEAFEQLNRSARRK